MLCVVRKIGFSNKIVKVDIGEIWKINLEAQSCITKLSIIGYGKLDLIYQNTKSLGMNILSTTHLLRLKQKKLESLKI